MKTPALILTLVTSSLAMSINVSAEPQLETSREHLIAQTEGTERREESRDDRQETRDDRQDERRGEDTEETQATAETSEFSDEPLDDCIPLEEVSTGQTEIRKQIKNELLGPGNWNTDFAVPGEENFDFFVAFFTPENDARYQGAVYFKYPDETTTTVFDGERDLQRNETYSQIFVSPTVGKQPSQINARIGGQTNTVYRIAFLGCKS